jgi:polar amino acid transport system substrate-binding protein
MRKGILAMAAVALATAACSSSSSSTTSAASGSASSSAGATAQECVTNVTLYSPGTLTIATDNPVFQPWFGGTGSYQDWTGKPSSGTGNPATGEGYESAVAYAIADQLGFSKDQVTWTPVNFNLSYKPGPTAYDFYIGQVSYSDKRAEAVDFSANYYDNNQALVVNKGTPIASAATIADLKNYKLGAQVGTTSYDYIVENIQPTQEPAVYETSTDVITALNNGQIDGYVVDVATAYVNVLIGEATNGVVVGQFPSGGEYFGTTSSKANPIVPCIDMAIDTLTSDGTLEQLQKRWLASLDYPVIK